MKKILITYNTRENYSYLIKFINNLELYGIKCKFIKLSHEAKKNSDNPIPQIFKSVYDKYEDYCRKLKLNNRKVKNLIIVLDKIFNTFKPDIVIVFGNKIDDTCGILYECSKIKGLKILFSENTPIPGTFYIEKKPRFEFIKEIKNLKEIIDTDNYQKLIERGKKISFKIRKELPTRHFFNKNNSIKISKALKSKKIKILILGSDIVGHAFIPPNHEYKKYTFPIFNDYRDMFNYLCKEKNLDFWFKPHPNESFLEYYENIEKRDNLYLFDTYDDPNILIKNSDIVIAAMSKLEINAFVLGKPIIYAGTGWFWSQDYSKDCLNKDQIVNSIYEILENKPTSAEVDSFYAAIGMYEKKYINFYDYCTKKNLTSNIDQVKKFYNLINLSFDNFEERKNKFTNSHEIENYLKETGYKKENMFKKYIKKSMFYNIAKIFIKR